MFNHMLSHKGPRAHNRSSQGAAPGDWNPRRTPLAIVAAAGGKIVPSAAATRINLYQILSYNAIKDG